MKQTKLCYYDPITRELYGTRYSKAVKFLELGCVEQFDDAHFFVHPIKGYNKTKYSVTLTSHGDCNCQFHQKTGEYCSHILAVVLYKQKLKEVQSLK